MENPPNGVVNCLRFRESLVSAFVGCQESISGRPVPWECRKISRTDDPEASGYQSGAIAIECPKSEPGQLVGVRVRILDVGGGDQRLDGDGGLVDDSKQEAVPDSGEKVRLPASRRVEAEGAHM